MQGVSSAPGTPSRTESETDTNGARFDEIYRSHRPALVAYATKRDAHDPELVADLALLDGYRALDRMRSDHPRAMWAYLYRALNSHLIREGAKPRPELRADLDPFDTTDTFEETVVGDLDLDSALASLPEGQEQALRLRLVDDMSAAEIGAELGKSPAAVRQLQHQGIRRLRRLLFAAVLVVLLAVAAAVSLFGSDNGRPIDFTPATTVPGPDERRETTDSTTPTDRVESESDELGGPRLGQAFAATEGTDASAATNAAPALVPPDVPPPEPVRLIAHDGFDLGLSDGATVPVLRGGGSAEGFGSDWTIEAGSLEARFDAAGLTYTDIYGTQLQTVPGALQLQSNEKWTNLVRPLLEPPTDEAFWVSYLIRVDSPGIGDAFWFGGDGVAGPPFGIQTDPEVRFVQGPSSEFIVESGSTMFIVAEVDGDTARLWVNPSLIALDAPMVTLDSFATDETGAPGFAIFNYSAALYTVDEYRIGAAYADVAPRR